MVQRWKKFELVIYQMFDFIIFEMFALLLWPMSLSYFILCCSPQCPVSSMVCWFSSAQSICIIKTLRPVFYLSLSETLRTLWATFQSYLTKNILKLFIFRLFGPRPKYIYLFPTFKRSREFLKPGFRWIQLLPVKRPDMKMLNSNFPIEIQMRGRFNKGHVDYMKTSTSPRSLKYDLSSWEQKGKLFCRI